MSSQASTTNQEQNECSPESKKKESECATLNQNSTIPMIVPFRTLLKERLCALEEESTLHT